MDFRNSCQSCSGLWVRGVETALVAAQECAPRGQMSRVTQLWENTLLWQVKAKRWRMTCIGGPRGKARFQLVGNRIPSPRISGVIRRVSGALTCAVLPCTECLVHIRSSISECSRPWCSINDSLLRRSGTRCAWMKHFGERCRCTFACSVLHL